MRSRQAAIGAAVAVMLVLGANAGSLNSAPLQAGMQGELLNAHIASVMVRACGGAMLPHTSMASALQACGDRAFGEALDIVGEIAAHLKQR